MKTYRIANNGDYLMTATIKEDRTGVIKVVIKNDEIEPEEITSDFESLVFELYNYGISNDEQEHTDYKLKADIGKKTITVRIKSHECYFEDRRVITEFTYHLGHILRSSSKEVRV